MTQPIAVGDDVVYFGSQKHRHGRYKILHIPEGDRGYVLSQDTENVNHFLYNVHRSSFKTLDELWKDIGGSQ